jgi:hypothetical protein
LLKKLKESKIIKVVSKPHIEEVEQKTFIAPPSAKPKKAKKVATKLEFFIKVKRFMQHVNYYVKKILTIKVKKKAILKHKY